MSKNITPPKDFPADLLAPMKLSKKDRDALAAQSVAEVPEDIYAAQDAMLDKLSHANFDGVMDRWQQLFGYYDLDIADESAWKALCQKLVYDLLPGFSYERESRGRNQKWTDGELCNLWLAVEELLPTSQNIKSACKALAKKKKWRKKIEKQTGNREYYEVLYEVYHQAQSNAYVRFIKNIREALGEKFSPAEVAELNKKFMK